jgi:hypothetical protein
MNESLVILENILLESKVEDMFNKIREKKKQIKKELTKHGIKINHKEIEKEAKSIIRELAPLKKQLKDQGYKGGLTYGEQLVVKTKIHAATNWNRLFMFAHGVRIASLVFCAIVFIISLILTLFGAVNLDPKLFILGALIPVWIYLFKDSIKEIKGAREKNQQMAYIYKNADKIRLNKKGEYVL